MEEETNLTYEERLKERRSVILKINEVKAQLKQMINKISDLETELKKLNEKKQNFEEKILNFEEKILNLEEELIKKGIAVPEEGNYEIRNGLLGAKRDLNLKLMKDLEDEDVRQVFIYVFRFLLFYFKFRYSE
jgi:chromosome segregation ATPase